MVTYKQSSDEKYTWYVDIRCICSSNDHRAATLNLELKADIPKPTACHSVTNKSCKVPRGMRKAAPSQLARLLASPHDGCKEGRDVIFVALVIQRVREMQYAVDALAARDHKAHQEVELGGLLPGHMKGAAAVQRVNAQKAM